MYFPENKQSCLAMFITCILERIDYSVEKACIGQSVPDNWYSETKKAAKDIRDKF